MTRHETKIQKIENELTRKIGSNIRVKYIPVELYEPTRNYQCSHLVLYEAMTPDIHDQADSTQIQQPFESLPFDVPEIPGEADIYAVPAAEQEGKGTNGKSFFRVMKAELLEEERFDD